MKDGKRILSIFARHFVKDDFKYKADKNIDVKMRLGHELFSISKKSKNKSQIDLVDSLS